MELIWSTSADNPAHCFPILSEGSEMPYYVKSGSLDGRKYEVCLLRFVDINLKTLTGYSFWFRIP